MGIVVATSQRWSEDPVSAREESSWQGAMHRVGPRSTAICFVISTYPITEGCFVSGWQNGEPVTPAAAPDPYVRVMVGASRMWTPERF